MSSALLILKLDKGDTRREAIGHFTYKYRIDLLFTHHEQPVPVENKEKPTVSLS